MKARTVAAFGAIAALTAIAAAPASAELPDARCDAVGSPANMGDVRVAQTFTALNTGPLARFEVLASLSTGLSDTTWAVQINTVDGTGKPTNTSLAGTTISFPPSGSPTRVGGSFANPAPVTAGTQYALVITKVGSGATPIGKSPSSCPGQVYGDGSLTGTWPFSYSVFDLTFATFIAEPEPPQTEPLDSSAPAAQITKGPKDKTKKKAATFEFTGTDARMVAGFQCSLDGKPFAPCTSPHTVKVKKGKHTFEVKAVDQAGNVGAPASDTWKRKRKKK